MPDAGDGGKLECEAGHFITQGVHFARVLLFHLSVLSGC
jgi:hypothetical protein